MITTNSFKKEELEGAWGELIDEKIVDVKSCGVDPLSRGKLCPTYEN